MEYTEALKKRAAEAKSDLIGWIYKSDLFDLLDAENDQSKGEREAWNAFMETLGSVTGDAPVKMRNDVEDRAQDFFLGRGYCSRSLHQRGGGSRACKGAA